MTYATAFSGVGGWEVGLRDSGWFLKWQCEFDPKLQRFLADRFGVPVHGDVRTLAQADLETVDVLIGSPPCQPFSTAGKRGGTSDERHLYPSFIDAVRAFKPRWVLMEQVPAILSAERDKATGKLTGPAPIGAYIGGLAALGYLGCYHCIPACALGAPHRRDRVWIIAHADANRTRREEQHPSAQSGWAGMDPWISDSENDANPQEQRRGKGHKNCERGCVRTIAEKKWTRSSKCSWWEIEPDVDRVAHGISHAVDRLKGLGNAIVPLLAKVIGESINQIERD